MKQLKFKTGLDQSPFFYIAGAGVLILPLIINLYSSTPFEIPKMVAYYLLALASLVAIAFKAKKSELVWDRKGVTLFAAFVTLYVLLSFFARDPYFAFFGTRYVESAVFLIAGLPLLVAFLQVRQAEWEKIFWILPFQSFAISLLALAQTFFKIATYDYLKIVLIRATSTLGSAAFLVYYLNFAFLVTLFFFIRERRFWPKTFLGVVLFIDLWAIVMSGARAGWIALFGALVVLLVVVMRDRHKRAVVGAVLAIFLLIFGLFVNLSRSDRMQNIFSSADFNVSSRISIWKLSTSLAQRYPVFGIGPNNLMVYYAEERPRDLVPYDKYFDQAHNLPLQMLLNVGVVGLALLLGFFWAVYRNLFKILKEYSFELIIALSLGTILVHALLQPLDITSWFFIFALSAILLGRNTKPLVLSKRVKDIAPVLYLIAAIGTVAVIAWAVSDQYYYWAKYNAAQGNYTEAVSKLDKAMSVNPYNGDYYFYKAKYTAYSSGAYDASAEKIGVMQPNLTRAIIRKANVQLYVGSLGNDALKEEGFKTLRRAMAIEKDNAQLLVMYASWKLSFGEVSEVEEPLLQAYELSPSNPLTLRLLASYYERTGNYEKRQEALQKLYLLDPLDFSLKHFLEYQKVNNIKLPFPTDFSPTINAW
jgi:O-antigen ligase